MFLIQLTAKIEKMSQQLEISPEERNDSQAACEVLHKLLSKYYPDCLLQMFDSSTYVNSLGVTLLFLPFPEYNNLVSKLHYLL